MADKIRVLGVGDPAVYAYTDETVDALGAWHSGGGVPVSFDIVPWDRYLVTLNEQFQASKPAYDIVMLPGHLWLPEFVEADRLAPLTRLVSDIPVADWEDIKPAVRAELSYKDEVYLMPSFTDGHLVFMRTDLLGGIPVSEVTTPIQIAEIARRYDGPGARGIALKAHPSEIFLDWLPYLWAHGGEILSDNGEPAFASEKGVRSLELYRELRDVAPENTGEFGNEEIARVLRDGSVALATSWGGQAGFIYAGNGGYREDIATAPFTTPWNVAWSFGVLSAAPDVPAAFEVLRYLSSPEVDRKVGRYAGSPVRRSSYERDRDVVPWYNAQERMLDQSKRLPYHPAMSSVVGIITDQLRASFTRDRSAKDALEQAAAGVREVV